MPQQVPVKIAALVAGRSQMTLRAWLAEKPSPLTIHFGGIRGGRKGRPGRIRYVDLDELHTLNLARGSTVWRPEFIPPPTVEALRIEVTVLAEALAAAQHRITELEADATRTGQALGPELMPVSVPGHVQPQPGGMAHAGAPRGQPHLEAAEKATPATRTTRAAGAGGSSGSNGWSDGDDVEDVVTNRSDYPAVFDRVYTPPTPAGAHPQVSLAAWRAEQRADDAPDAAHVPDGVSATPQRRDWTGLAPIGRPGAGHASQQVPENVLTTLKRGPHTRHLRSDANLSEILPRQLRPWLHSERGQLLLSRGTYWRPDAVAARYGLMRWQTFGRLCGIPDMTLATHRDRVFKGRMSAVFSQLTFTAVAGPGATQGHLRYVDMQQRLAWLDYWHYLAVERRVGSLAQTFRQVSEGEVRVLLEELARLEPYIPPEDTVRDIFAALGRATV